MLALGIFGAAGQSKNFTLAQSLDIQNSILARLADEYVDSVKFDAIMMKGIEAMLAELDPYTVYYPEELEENLEMMTTGIYGGVGAVIKKRVGEAVVISEPYFGSPAVKAGIQPGDSIIAIDDIPVYGETSSESSSRMKGQAGTTVRFKVVKGRTKDTINYEVLRERIHVSDVPYGAIVRDSVGYIVISGFTQNVTRELREKVLELKGQGAKRLVLDLRDNGGGLMDEAVKMASLFVPVGTMVVSSKGKADGMTKKYYTKDQPVDTTIPIMVLVNSSTASSSEIVAGALQDLDRATIAGTRTYGKGLIQSMRPTTYNGTLKLTTGRYYTPSRRCVQAIDYSHGNSDGSVGHIPDSLTHEFKTKKGRTVKDGGGITPDITIEGESYSRTAYSLVVNDILGEYAIRYFVSHPQIAPVAEFSLSDAEYEEFVKYAAAQDVDFRSGLQAEMDNLVRIAKFDGMYEGCKAELDALTARVNMGNENLLRELRKEIQPLLEHEIVVRYYFSGPATVVAMKDDKQLFKALDSFK